MKKFNLIGLLVFISSLAAHAMPQAVPNDKLVATQTLVANVIGKNPLDCSIRGSRSFGNIPPSKMILASTQAWSEQTGVLPTYEFVNADSKGQSYQMVVLSRDGQSLKSLTMIYSVYQSVKMTDGTLSSQLVPYQVLECK